VGVMAKVDFKGLEKFAKQLKKLNEEQLNQFNEAAIKELAARLLAKVIKRTPVGVYPAKSGKKGGTLRRGWTIGEVVKTDGKYTVEVINPTEYASYVEFGHRTANHEGWVQGRFMLTISEQELEKDAPRILENKLKKFLGGVFK
jgi:HK97 gp10 family phage protein